MNGRLAINAPQATEGDADLVQGILSGDRSAFERLMRRYNRRLYRLARAVLRDGTEAEDALQDAYLAAWRKMDQFRGSATLSTWLSRLVLNECLGRLRRTARRDNVAPMIAPPRDEEIDNMGIATTEAPDAATARIQLRTLLERKLDELPEGFRTVFVCRSVEELSVEETAASLGLPEATVRSRHFRARSLLRESLAQAIDAAERDVFDFGNERCDRMVAQVLARVAAQ
ncbi:MAG: RNA polymerase sigma factor [Steroidobacteraceae bacterium]|nr:RNA polymerase sigma factor [Steroidobacteraceae bacterium]